jgi:hypothetical protein
MGVCELRHHPQRTERRRQLADNEPTPIRRLPATRTSGRPARNSATWLGASPGLDLIPSVAFTPYRQHTAHPCPCQLPIADGRRHLTDTSSLASLTTPNRAGDPTVGAWCCSATASISGSRSSSRWTTGTAWRVAADQYPARSRRLSPPGGAHHEAGRGGALACGVAMSCERPMTPPRPWPLSGWASMPSSRPCGRPPAGGRLNSRRRSTRTPRDVDWRDGAARPSTQPWASRGRRGEWNGREPVARGTTQATSQSRPLATVVAATVLEWERGRQPRQQRQRRWQTGVSAVTRGVSHEHGKSTCW